MSCIYTSTKFNKTIITGFLVYFLITVTYLVPVYKCGQTDSHVTIWEHNTTFMGSIYLVDKVKTLFLKILFLGGKGSSQCLINLTQSWEGWYKRDLEFISQINFKLMSQSFSTFSNTGTYSISWSARNYLKKGNVIIGVVNTIIFTNTHFITLIIFTT